MKEVKVLIKGEHSKNEEEKLVIGSTVTLIKGNKNIIVDTGSFLDKDKIIEELKKENLTPEEINIVVLTHLHLDHLVNTYLFKNAKVFCKFKGGDYPGQIHYPNKGCLERAEIADGKELMKGVSFLLTPGHTPDMISVVVNTTEGKVVIAGDAFPSKDFLDLNKEPIAMLTDIPEFNKSRKKILEVADYIVPGHGDMFKVN